MLQAGWAGFHPVLSVGVPGSYAADVYEPCQDREEATVNGPPWVTWGRLDTLTDRAGRKSVFYVVLVLQSVFCGVGGLMARRENRLAGS